MTPQYRNPNTQRPYLQWGGEIVCCLSLQGSVSLLMSRALDNERNGGKEREGDIAGARWWIKITRGVAMETLDEGQLVCV